MAEFEDIRLNHLEQLELWVKLQRELDSNFRENTALHKKCNEENTLVAKIENLCKKIIRTFKL